VTRLRLSSAAAAAALQLLLTQSMNKQTTIRLRAGDKLATINALKRRSVEPATAAEHWQPVDLY